MTVRVEGRSGPHRHTNSVGQPIKLRRRLKVRLERDMSSTTPLPNSVPNEGTTGIEASESDQSISKNRRFSAASIIPPLLLISTVSVALGLAPYFRLRHHILRQSGMMQTIRSSIEDGNRRLLEHIRTRDMEAAARQMEYQKSQVELQLKIEELDRRYRDVEALSKRLSVMQVELDKSKAQNRETER